MKTFEEYLVEANGIKGWKRAHSDIMKSRRDSANAAKNVRLVMLKKDGTESKMYDATKYFDNEEKAKVHIKNIRKLNPGRTFKWNMYIGSAAPIVV